VKYLLDVHMGVSLIFEHPHHLSNAFYHIDMAEDSKKYLGFECFGQFYHYDSMPQGIHSAPFIFTEVTKPVVKS